MADAPSAGGAGPDKSTKATDPATAKGKAKGKSSGEGKATGHCSNCDIFGPIRRCTQCGVEAYCGEACQRVSECVCASQPAAAPRTASLEAPPRSSQPPRT